MSDDRGFIPAWRKLFDPDHDLAPSGKDPASRLHAWLDICQMAQHDDGHRQGGEVLNKGEVLIAVRVFARRWHWSKSRVHRFVSELTSSTRIGTVRGTPIGTVYRVVSYDTYATLGDGERDGVRDAQRDSSGTAAGHEQPQNHITTTTLSPRNRKHALPDTWRPNDRHTRLAKELGLPLDAECDKFRDHAKATNRKLSDWDAGFRNWLRKGAEIRGPRTVPTLRAGKFYR